MNKTQPKDIKLVSVYCGELCESNECTSETINLVNWKVNGIQENITVGLGSFVVNPHSLSDRIIDLLQIAAYVFCADRLTNRGERRSVNNAAWARSFKFNIPVIDIDFWCRTDVQNKLNAALKYMTGDRMYSFVFTKTKMDALEKERAQQSLFSKEYLSPNEAEKTDIMLFSGGLDSLAGAIERLSEYPERKICLVSHKSNNVVMNIQKNIIDYLQKTYGKRVLSYGFECHNKKLAPSKEETQRTRIFLFTAIAFAICNCYEKKELYIYENGVTSLNFPKQTDVFNARASRTTHPKTIGLLKEFYELFDPSFQIITPYYNKTKTEIVVLFKKYHQEKILSSAVSCSSSRNRPVTMPHCGCCSQCIDRIFAVYAAGLQEYDAQYSEDIIMEISDDETTQRVYNTLRLAAGEKIADAYELMERYPTEVMDIIEYWPSRSGNPDDSLMEIYDLYCRFADSIIKAAKKIQFYREDISVEPHKPSILSILADRSYLQTPFLRRVCEIDDLLRKAIPLTFQREQPTSENDFNDKIQGILVGHGAFSREYPSLKFGQTEYKADHAEAGLMIESKYIRANTSPSVALKGITNDMVQIPEEYGILFIVYDPHRSIIDDDNYISSLEQKRANCYVRIYR